MPQIFLNYRRSDTGSDTHRLYDRLTRHYRSEQIFIDTTNIEFGTKFRHGSESWKVRLTLFERPKIFYGTSSRNAATFGLKFIQFL